MNINVNNLQEVLKKATLGFTIPSVQLKVGERVTSKMKMQNNTVVVVLDLPNDVISGVPGELELNFDEPATKVKPYLALIDNDIVSTRITDDKMTLIDGKHRTNLHFCMPSFVTTFSGDSPQFDPFYTLEMTEEIKDCFDKIRKVAGKFEKVYFKVVDGVFSVETTDRQNRYANGITFELDTIGQADCDICFDFKNFNALLQCIGDSSETFIAKFTWMEAQQAGMVLFEKTDGSEKYYLLSKLET